MEAATALHHDQVRIVGDRLVVDRLVVEDACAVRLAAATDDAAALVRDAIEVGARILDREQVGAQSEVVKTEFAALREAFDVRAKRLAERLDEKVEEAFGDEDGSVARVMARHFGDDSSHAVQHKVRSAFADVAKEMREDLRRQLFAEGDDNPLAKFHRIQIAVAERAEKRHSEDLRGVRDQVEAMRLELERLRSEKQKLEELTAERDRGTAKGRTYEEAVAEALDRLAAARGDDCEAVGDTRGEGGRKGDVLVGIEGCAGPARGRIVFEVKHSRISRNEALAQLDGALRTRDADYAVLVVPGEERLPARTNPLREYNGDKLFVVFDPEDEASELALEVAYGLARARVLMTRSEAAGVDADAVRAEVERAIGALEAVRKVKTQLTNARTGIDVAQGLIQEMASTVREHLAEVTTLLAEGEAAAERPVVAAAEGEAAPDPDAAADEPRSLHADAAADERPSQRADDGADERPSLGADDGGDEPPEEPAEADDPPSLRDELAAAVPVDHGYGEQDRLL